jgi:signal transduction histidine kinase
MNTNEPISRKPLRLWPGIAVAVLLIVVGYVIPIFMPQYAGLGMIGAALCALIVILWWVLFSRARWYERLGAIVLIIVAVIAERPFVHASIAGGAMGNLSYILAIPTLSVALVAWAAVSRRLAPGARAAAAVVAVVLGCLPWILVRTGGINADGRSDFHLRWTPTPEERLLAQADEPLDAARGGPKPLPPAPAPAETPKPAVAASPEDKATKETAAPAAAKVEPAAAPVPTKLAEWPGFRGPGRDSVIHGVQISTDWAQSPPVQTWRRPIGPRWSS